MKTLSNLILFLLICGYVSGQDSSEARIEKERISYMLMLDSAEKSFKYEYGKINLNNGLATLTVPDGYKFLDSIQSEYVLTKLWGNPPEPVLGMLLPDSTSPVSNNFIYAVEITYSEEGYIRDDDAKEIDYTELLKEMKQDTDDENPERVKNGYPAITLIGWASSPYYDETSKKLHWAKELKFGDNSTNTLNYNIRVLGRKGFLNLNAIGDMTVLPVFKKDVEKILASIKFNDGFEYSDFDPEIDEVAAYGIAGIIAGKALAKAGFFAVVLKFWKVIMLGIVALFAAFRKKIFGRKNEE